MEPFFPHPPLNVDLADIAFNWDRFNENDDLAPSEDDEDILSPFLNLDAE